VRQKPHLVAFVDVARLSVLLDDDHPNDHPIQGWYLVEKVGWSTISGGFRSVTITPATPPSTASSTLSSILVTTGLALQFGQDAILL
jgi:hypothetical protein